MTYSVERSTTKDIKIKIFGFKVYAFVPSEKRTKLKCRCGEEITRYSPYRVYRILELVPELKQAVLFILMKEKKTVILKYQILFHMTRETMSRDHRF